MATTEELNVLIKTTLDPSGIQQTQGQIQQLTSQQQFANTVLRQSMAQVPQTMAAFQAQARAVEQQVGARPTLLPEDLGIKAAAAATATRAVGETSRVTTNEMVRLGAAAIGVGAGLSTFTIAGNLVHAALSSIIDDTIAVDRAMRLNTITLGAQATGFQQYAQTIGQQTGFTQQALLEAGTSAQQFGRQIGLIPEEVQNLVGVSAQLAQVLGTDVNQTMTLLSSAMQGNQQAADALGLQLDDATVAYTQLGGASADYFKALDPATQATLRYQAALQQAADITKIMPGPVQDLQKAQNQLNAEWERLANTIGPPLIETLAKIAAGTNAALEAAQANAQQQGTDPGFKNELALLQKLQDINARPGIEYLQQLGDALGNLKEHPEEAAKALSDYLNEVNASTPLQQTVAQANEEVATSVVHVADAEERATNFAEARARTELLAARQLAQVNVTQLSNERVRLQREQVDLAGEEARIRLSALPTQERMAALQRDITEQQIRARQAALPANEALEDVQYMQQRLQLQLQTRGLLSPEERANARRDLRQLARAEPGFELTALDANRGVTLTGRAATRVDMAARLQDLALQRELAPVQASERQAQLVSAIVAAQLQAAQQYQQELTVVVNITSTAGTTEQFTQTFHNARLAADNQASVNLAGAA